MKKVLVLMMLLCAVFTGAWAQTTASYPSTLKGNKYYTIATSSRGGLSVSSDKVQLCGTQESTTNSGSKNPSSESHANHFVFIQQNGNYYLYNLLAYKYVNLTTDKGTLESTPSAPVYFKTEGSGTVMIYGDDNHIVNLGGSNQITLDTWGGPNRTDGGKNNKDAGNSFSISEAGSIPYLVVCNNANGGIKYNTNSYTDGTTFTIDGDNYITESVVSAIDVPGYTATITFDGAKVNVVYAESGAELIPFNDGDKVIIKNKSYNTYLGIHSSNKITGTTTKGNENIWTLKTANSTSYKLYNESTGKYLGKIESRNGGIEAVDEGSAGTWQIEKEGDYAVLKNTNPYAGAQYFYLHQVDWTGYTPAYQAVDWNKDADASQWTLERPLSINVTYNADGHHWSTTGSAFEGLQPDINDFNNVEFYDNFAFASGDLTVSESNKDFIINCRDNFPFEPGKLCRIQTKRDVSVGGDFYVHTDSKAYAKQGETTYSDNKNIWVIEHVEGTPDIFTVRSYYNNKYLTLASSSSAAQTTLESTRQGSAQAPYQNETTSYFKVMRSTHSETLDGFCFTHPKSVRMCMAVHYTPSNPSSTGYGVGGYASADNVARKDNALFTYPIESFTATLNAVPGDGFYGTIYMPFNMEPSMAEVYAATASEGIMQLHKVEGVAPAGAYILRIPYTGCAEGEKLTEPITASSETPTTVEHNDLNGSINVGKALPNQDTFTYYVLGKKEEMGFYRYTVGTYPTAKAVYRTDSSIAPVNGFTFEFSEDPILTAIEQLQQEHMVGATIYDLQGRRMQNAVKGLNIVNGKKVIR